MIVRIMKSPELVRFHYFPYTYQEMYHVTWVPCHNSMACPRVVDGGNGLQLYRVAANTLNKQPLTADKGCPSSVVVGNGANNLLL
jgi:hypothetical protein